MWIDASQHTKPCSVVISRISTPCKTTVSNPKTVLTEGHSHAVKSKKTFRTSFERSLIIKSGLTGLERKSSRLHGPKSRLRSRTVLNYSIKMPAPVKKDSTSTHLDERQKTTHSTTYFKPGEWQKSSSLNSFKLRLKCLNKEKSLQTKRKWTLQHSKLDDTSKLCKEDASSKSSAVTETENEKVKIKNDVLKKPYVPANIVSKNLNSPAKHSITKVTSKSDKKPLSKLVISCNKAYKHHLAMLGKPTGVKTKLEPKLEEPKIIKKMTAYTVYTKLRENSIESINCKRYKKRKDVKTKTDSYFGIPRETKSLNIVSELSNLKNDGSVEADVRATLDALLKDVVSAELDELLNVEAPSAEIRDLLRVFCRQYGYNYDKDFADIQNSVLNFKVTDSVTPSVKKSKPNFDTHEFEQKRGEMDSKTTFRKSLKRRRKRKRDSSEESDEEECPEILSAVMRSRSKDRRNRLSLQSSEAPVSLKPKRYLRRSFPTEQVPLATDDSEMEYNVSAKYKALLNSTPEEPTKTYSDENDETDCGDINDHNVSGHMYIPPLSSEDSSEDEEPITDNPVVFTKELDERCNIAESDKEPCDGRLLNTMPSDSPKPPELQKFVNSGESPPRENDSVALPQDTNVSASMPSILPQDTNVAASIPSILPQDTNVAASMPSISTLLQDFEDKTKQRVLETDTAAAHTVSSQDTRLQTEEKNMRPESPMRPISPVGSPDMDWESDKLVICLDPEESNAGESTPIAEESAPIAEESAPNAERASPEPVREILYHTPKLPIDSRVTEFFRVANNNNNTPSTGSYSPTHVQNGEASAKEGGFANSRITAISPQRTEAISKEASKEAQGAHLPSKHHRTPVQKVLPQVKMLNPALVNSYDPHQNHSAQKGLATVHPKPQFPVQNIDPETRNLDLPSLTSSIEYPQTQSTPVSTVPSTSSNATPLVNQIAPTVCVPPLPTQIPSSVPMPTLSSTRVPSLAVVPVISPPTQNQTSSKTTNAAAIPLASRSPPVQSGSMPVTSDTVPVVGAVNVSSPDASSLNRTVETTSIQHIQSSLPQLNSQNALDISILRSLLLDPPPEDIQNNDIHNLILKKAKELEEKEELQDAEFNMPVISNVVSLKEEALKKGTDAVVFDATQEPSPVPKTTGSEQDPFQERNSDSPEIVEEKLKPTTKQLQAVKTNTPQGEAFADVLRNLQLEIRNLEKMAEEKKKEYFLIMYVRNFKRDTLRRLHESLQTKTTVSHPSKAASQCTPGTEPSHTHLKETCLVRPMVQIQPQSAPLSLSQTTKSPEPQKDVRIVNPMSDPQPKHPSFSPDQRRTPVGNLPPVNSSLAALTKVESDYRTGFRSYLSHPGNGKETAYPKVSEVSVNSSPSSFSKYQPLLPHKKSSPQIPEAHHKTVSATVTQPPSVSNVPPPQITSSGNFNPGVSAWKGTVSAYLQKSKAHSGKPDFSTPHPAPPPPYANTVKNLLKHSSTTVTSSGVSPVPSLAKDYSKSAENLNSSRAHVTPGPTQLSQPPFLDFYPFHAATGVPNSYVQANPFWPASTYAPKHNSSLASLQAARDLYMNSLTLGAWRTARTSEAEVEKPADKMSSEKMWNPVSGSTMPRVTEPQKEAPQNLVTNRPYHYGLLRKCVVCKVADAQFICSGCGKDWYCSVSCQRQNWKIHSRSCISTTT